VKRIDVAHGVRVCGSIIAQAQASGEAATEYRKQSWHSDTPWLQ